MTIAILISFHIIFLYYFYYLVFVCIYLRMVYLLHNIFFLSNFDLNYTSLSYIYLIYKRKEKKRKKKEWKKKKKKLGDGCVQSMQTNTLHKAQLSNFLCNTLLFSFLKHMKINSDWYWILLKWKKKNSLLFLNILLTSLRVIDQDVCSQSLFERHGLMCTRIFLVEI